MLEVLAEEVIRNAKKKDVDAFEVFLQKKVVKKVEIRKRAIKNIIEQERSGYAIRAIVDKQMSFASSNSADQVSEVLDLSILSAKKSEQYMDNSFINKKYITPVEDIRDPRLIDLTMETITEEIANILTSTEESKPVQNIAGTTAIIIEERLIVNSEGLWKREVGTRMKADILTTLKIGDFIGLGSSRLVSRILVDDWQTLFNNAISSAYKQQNRQKLSIGRPRGIILGPAAIAKIIAHAFIPIFHHTSGSQYNESFSKGKFNKNIQLIDDPTFPGAQNTFGFDDEGFPSKPRTIISGGKRKRLLGMNFACGDEGKKNPYKGNCYRVKSLNLETRSYTYYPTVSSSNFILKPKKSGRSDLISKLSNGIYIKDIAGAQDANYFTGDFVVSVVEGYEIKNGSITNPIQPIFLSGNIYKILEDSSLELGNNLTEVNIPATPMNVIVPDLLTSRMTISI